MAIRPLADGFHEVAPGKLACIVTSLEMKVRPDISAPHAPPGISLDLVSAPEADWYRDLFRHVGEDWLWFGRLSLSDDALLAIIRDANVQVYALTIDGKPEGLLELDFRQPDECELAYFGISKLHTGRKLGPWMMHHACREAWARPIRRFWVHTCTLDHPAALGFYIRSGFVPFRRRVEIADDPRLDGRLRPDCAMLQPRL